MRKRLSWLVAALMVSLAPTAAHAATPTWGGGGFGSGGVIDNEVLVLFEFDVDGDVLNLHRLAWWSGVEEEGQQDPESPDCHYSGNTADSDGLSYVDLGRSLVIRIEGAEASCGPIHAELEVIYRDSLLDTSPIADEGCDGDLRRGVLRHSDSAVASVYIQTDDLIIEAVGDTGSANYSFERSVCVDTQPAP